MGGFLVTYPSDQIRVMLIILVFVRIKLIPAALLIGVWFLIQLEASDFVSQHQLTGKRVYFTLLLGTRDALRGAPMQIRYQPNW